jgi:hypothetical protein
VKSWISVQYTLHALHCTGPKPVSCNTLYTRENKRDKSGEELEKVRETEKNTRLRIYFICCKEILTVRVLTNIQKTFKDSKFRNKPSTKYPQLLFVPCKYRQLYFKLRFVPEKRREK